MIIVELDKIVVTARRKLRADKVRELAASIDEIGLINPIVVYTKGDKQGKHHPWLLAAGRHRLEAMLSLGMVTTDVDVVLEEKAELVEIDENLIRNELGKPARVKALARRKEIFYERRLENEENSGASHANIRERGRPKEFATDASEKTGMSKSEINRDIVRAAKLAPDVLDAIENKNIPATHIDALASLTHEEQRQAVERMMKSDETAMKAVEFIRSESIDPDSSAPTDRKLPHSREWYAEKRRYKSFQGTMGVIDGLASAKLADLDLPQLSPNRLVQEIETVKKLEKSIRTFRHRLEELNSGNRNEPDE